ncbi:uncharacterized protein PV09_09089 [Verruconis gallopava]|uniref:Uncharacterized protein n=1 Tax=Verruconis gallopava TaxID=253628 RepID=A0A0D1XAJ9_9PEZI|nr:uncharacterized protein PV09_09089 [Verruconis gallopava]KIV99225.1 hypothetical protein PV09_09089 [Verruconis gallopava]
MATTEWLFFDNESTSSYSHLFCDAGLIVQFGIQGMSPSLPDAFQDDTIYNYCRNVPTATFETANFTHTKSLPLKSAGNGFVQSENSSSDSRVPFFLPCAPVTSSTNTEPFEVSYVTEAHSHAAPTSTKLSPEASSFVPSLDVGHLDPPHRNGYLEQKGCTSTLSPSRVLYSSARDAHLEFRESDLESLGDLPTSTTINSRLTSPCNPPKGLSMKELNDIINYKPHLIEDRLRKLGLKFTVEPEAIFTTKTKQPSHPVADDVISIKDEHPKANSWFETGYYNQSCDEADHAFELCTRHAQAHTDVEAFPPPYLDAITEAKLTSWANSIEDEDEEEQSLQTTTNSQYSGVSDRIARPVGLVFEPSPQNKFLVYGNRSLEFFEPHMSIEARIEKLCKLGDRSFEDRDVAANPETAWRQRRLEEKSRKRAMDDAYFQHFRYTAFDDSEDGFSVSELAVRIAEFHMDDCPDTASLSSALMSAYEYTYITAPQTVCAEFASIFIDKDEAGADTYATKIYDNSMPELCGINRLGFYREFVDLETSYNDEDTHFQGEKPNSTVVYHDMNRRFCLLRRLVLHARPSIWHGKMIDERIAAFELLKNSNLRLMKAPVVFGDDIEKVKATGLSYRRGYSKRMSFLDIRKKLMQESKDGWKNLPKLLKEYIGPSRLRQVQTHNAEVKTESPAAARRLQAAKSYYESRLKALPTMTLEYLKALNDYRQESQTITNSSSNEEILNFFRRRWTRRQLENQDANQIMKHHMKTAIPLHAICAGKHDKANKCAGTFSNGVGKIITLGQGNSNSEGNVGYSDLETIIDHHSDQPYDKWMNQIWAGLSISNTFVDSDEEEVIEMRCDTKLELDQTGAQEKSLSLRKALDTLRMSLLQTTPPLVANTPSFVTFGLLDKAIICLSPLRFKVVLDLGNVNHKILEGTRKRLHSAVVKNYVDPFTQDQFEHHDIFETNPIDRIFRNPRSDLLHSGDKSNQESTALLRSDRVLHACNGISEDHICQPRDKTAPAYRQLAGNSYTKGHILRPSVSFDSCSFDGEPRGSLDATSYLTTLEEEYAHAKSLLYIAGVVLLACLLW